MTVDAKTLYPNRGFRGAYLKGREAARRGKKRESCPYRDHRTFRTNHVTYSRGFITAWYRGFDDETREPSGPPEGRLV